jgi:hypothetical protein
MIGDIGKKMGRDGIDNGYIQVSRLEVEQVLSYQKCMSSILGIINVSDLTVHAREDPSGAHVNETHAGVEGWNRYRPSKSFSHISENVFWTMH